MTEPTSHDIMDALREIRVSLTEHRSQLAELRSQVATLRAELAGYQLAIYTQLGDIRRHLGTLTDALAEFRSEYNQHGH